MLEKVMVTVDGSALSEKAIDHARNIVAPNGTIHVFSVFEVPEVATGAYPGYVIPKMDSETLADAKTGAYRYVKRLADELQADGYQATADVDTGSPAERIIAKAKEYEAQTIVISTHGRSGFNQWLFGSVTQQILRQMPCPVFVVPGRLADD